jgi:hypothetical protein
MKGARGGAARSCCIIAALYECEVVLQNRSSCLPVIVVVPVLEPVLLQVVQILVLPYWYWYYRY